MDLCDAKKCVDDEKIQKSLAKLKTKLRKNCGKIKIKKILVLKKMSSFVVLLCCLVSLKNATRILEFFNFFNSLFK
tara:strand:- start:198 stop:425 length:228 start_codon:yes stop_codon:yes gene_type:complete